MLKVKLKAGQREASEGIRRQKVGQFLVTDFGAATEPRSLTTTPMLHDVWAYSQEPNKRTVLREHQTLEFGKTKRNKWKYAKYDQMETFSMLFDDFRVREYSIQILSENSVAPPGRKSMLDS